MPAQVSWHLENRVVGIRLFDNVTLDDVVDMSDQAIALLDQSDAPLVHMLIDEQDMISFPRQFRDIYSAAEVMNHPQMGWAVFYGTENKLIQLIAHMVSEMAHMRHRRFRTYQEAVAFLQSMDSTLPNLSEAALSQ